MAELSKFRRGAVLVLVAAAILAVVLVALHFTNLSAARGDLDTATAKGPVVQVVEAGAAPSQRTVTVLASVTPYQQATLYAKVSGYLSQVLVDKGDAVKAGQLLATIQSQEIDAQYNSARADLINKERNARRYDQLLRQNAIAAQQADQADADKGEPPPLGGAAAAFDIGCLRHAVIGAKVKCFCRHPSIVPGQESRRSLLPVVRCAALTIKLLSVACTIDKAAGSVRTPRISRCKEAEFHLRKSTAPCFSAVRRPC